jgi:hypothetical protein
MIRTRHVHATVAKPEARSKTMSILSSVTSILEPITSPLVGFPGENCKPRPDDCDDKQFKSNYDHKDDYSKDSDKGDYSKHNDKDDYSRHDKDDHSKQAKNDDCSDDGRKGDYSHQGQNDYSKHADKDDYSNHGKDDYSKHDGGWKDAKNDDCLPHKDYCQPQKDHCQPQQSDDCGKDTHHNPGEVLAKCDFSHCDFGSPGADHTADMHGALASMSSGHALDYAIGQLGSADHFDIGHLDVPADTSHDMAHHA